MTAPTSSPAPMEGLLIELLLNPLHINRAVDRGPSADEKELAASFREFWGKKAELRRFNDGSIRESLICLLLPNKACWNRFLFTL